MQGRVHVTHENLNDFTRVRALRFVRLVHLRLTSSPSAWPAPRAATTDIATFFMGRVKYSSNDGNDCGGVGQDLMKLVSRASTLKMQEERKVRLTDANCSKPRSCS